MADMKNQSTCSMVTWIAAIIGAILVFLLAKGAVGLFVALLIGLAFGWFFRIALVQLFCTGKERAPIEAKDTHPGVAETAARASEATNNSRGSGTAATATVSVGGAAANSAETPKQTAANAKSDDATATKTAASSTATAEKAAKTEPAQTEPTKAEKAKPAAKKATKAKAADPATSGASTGKSDAGKSDASDAGKRPEALKAARGGQADDLKLIKGIGPKLEQLCNELGFYHFDQIANWTAEEVAWVNENLAGFKGRVTRDDWVKQAKDLAGK